jgi:hypothetical protein
MMVLIMWEKESTAVLIMWEKESMVQLNNDISVISMKLGTGVSEKMCATLNFLQM